MKKTLNIVRLENGKYVEDWQYSQGNFDVTETADILKACGVTFSNFKMFFERKKASFITVEITAKIV